ncbi:MAG: hypothetical protein ACE5ED_13235 [Rhodothalassiaceae bacterium]
MTPRLMKALLLAAGLALPLAAAGAAAAHPVRDSHRGHEAAEAHHYTKAARRHARRDARRHARAHARHEAREHARAAHAARHRHVYGYDGYGYRRYAYRLAWPRIRYRRAYGYVAPRYRYDDDCDGY